MTWNWESTCSAYVFVGRQLGSGTPCPWHAGRWSAGSAMAVHGQPAGYAARHPTVDQPWPFAPREYARLLLLRSRFATSQIATVRADTRFVLDDQQENQRAAFGWACDEQLRVSNGRPATVCRNRGRLAVEARRREIGL